MFNLQRCCFICPNALQNKHLQTCHLDHTLEGSILFFPEFQHHLFIMSPPLLACLSISSYLSASPYHRLLFSRKQVQGRVCTEHTQADTYTHFICDAWLLQPRLSLNSPGPVAKACRTFPYVLVAATSSNWGANIACLLCESQSSVALKKWTTRGNRVAYIFQNKHNCQSFKQKASLRLRLSAAWEILSKW